MIFFGTNAGSMPCGSAGMRAFSGSERTFRGACIPGIVRVGTDTVRRRGFAPFGINAAIA